MFTKIIIYSYIFAFDKSVNNDKHLHIDYMENHSNHKPNHNVENIHIYILRERERERETHSKV